MDKITRVLVSTLFVGLLFSSADDMSDFCISRQTSTRAYKTINKTDSLYQIVRIDTANVRFFVVIDSSLIRDIEKMQSIIENISARYSPKEKFENFKKYGFTLSFFSKRVYAAYKDELPSEKFADWNRNYLAEYESRNQELWVYPLLLDKKKFLLKVGQ